jgi:HSP20 family protein
MNLIRRSTLPVFAYRPAPAAERSSARAGNLFHEFFAPRSQRAARSTEDAAPARIGVSETDNTFDVQVALPGVKKEAIKLAIDGRRVTIEGERASPAPEGGKLVYSDGAARHYRRSFLLPTEVDEAGAEARFENGILAVRLPKKQVLAARRLTIQ